VVDLLKLEMKELFRQFVFRSLLLLCSVFGICLGILNDSMNDPVSAGVMEWCGILAVMLSAYGGLSVSREFNRNTIRNKIVVGHRRGHIFLAKLILVGMIYLMCIGLFILASFLIQWIIAGRILLQWKQLLTAALSAALCVALTVTISTAVRTDIAGLIPLLVLFLSMMFSGLGYEFIDHKIMDVINVFLPCGQMMAGESAVKFSVAVSCSLLETVLLCIAGCLIFRKADLN